MNYILDTHVLVWRFIEPNKLPPRFKKIFQDSESHFIVPAIGLLEVQYLTEIGRIEVAMGDFLMAVKDQDNFRIAPFDEIIMLHALKLTSNRDPFDRIILAHALATSTKILTKDQWMKKTASHLMVS